MKRRLAAVVLAASSAAYPAAAQPLRADTLPTIKVAPPPHAAVPSRLVFRDLSGQPRFLDGETAGAPRVLVFADYACSTLCGPALAIVGARLAETGLTAGRDYRLQVIGLDPASTPTQAARFGEVRLPAGVKPDMLIGDAGAIKAATASLGFRYAFDPATRTFAHPVAAFVLTPDGRLTRALSEVALTTSDLKTALAEAKRGAAPGLVEILAIACHGALQATGAFDAPVLFALRLGGAATVILGGAVLVVLSRRRSGSAA